MAIAIEIASFLLIITYSIAGGHGKVKCKSIRQQIKKLPTVWRGAFPMLKTLYPEDPKLWINVSKWGDNQVMT